MQHHYIKTWNLVGLIWAQSVSVSQARRWLIDQIGLIDILSDIISKEDNGPHLKRQILSICNKLREILHCLHKFGYLLTLLQCFYKTLHLQDVCTGLGLMVVLKTCTFLKLLGFHCDLRMFF